MRTLARLFHRPRFLLLVLISLFLFAVSLLLHGCGSKKVKPGIQVNHPFGSHQFKYAAGSILPSHVSPASLDEATRTFHSAWKAKHVRKGCGVGRYYVYVASDRQGSSDAQGGQSSGTITVSEAQGYGMLIFALMAGADPEAKTYFDGILKFSRDHPSRSSSHLLAWNQVESCANAYTDENDGAHSASDGDLDTAYALLLADRQWGSSGEIDYLAEAKATISAILEREVNPSSQLMLLGDFVSPDDPRHYGATRLSDFMPDHFRAFAAQTEAPRWGRVVDSSYRLVESLQSQFSPDAGLLPDFAENAGTDPKPASRGFLEGAHDGQFSYNACRVPWRIATDYLVSGDVRARRALQKLNAWVVKRSGGDPASLRDGYDLKGEAYSSDESLAFLAPFAVAAMTDESQQRWLNSLWDSLAGASVEDEQYYGNTLKLLAMITLSGNWWAP